MTPISTRPKPVLDASSKAREDRILENLRIALRRASKPGVWAKITFSIEDGVVRDHAEINATLRLSTASEETISTVVSLADRVGESGDA